jgi:hypothetical protein
MSRVKWSGVEGCLTPWTPWNDSKKGAQVVLVLEVYSQENTFNPVDSHSLLVVYASVPCSYKYS